jgi:hypothetical protein
MARRLSLSFLLTLLVLAFVVTWLGFSGGITYLKLNRRQRIEVNGVPVEEEIFRGKDCTAIVTRRDAGKMHSYQLLFAGNIDSTGNIGFVVDCQEGWHPVRRS